MIVGLLPLFLFLSLSLSMQFENISLSLPLPHPPTGLACIKRGRNAGNDPLLFQLDSLSLFLSAWCSLFLRQSHCSSMWYILCLAFHCRQRNDDRRPSRSRAARKMKLMQPFTAGDSEWHVSFNSSVCVINETRDERRVAAGRRLSEVKGTNEPKENLHLASCPPPLTVWSINCIRESLERRRWKQIWLNTG